MTESTGSDAYEDLLATFRDSSLPEPPIPERFRGRIRLTEERCWSTRPIDPMDMCMFGRYPSEVLAAKPDDYVAVSHAGHGANSYGISFHLVDGPLAVFVQVLWGGVYTDNEAEARLLGEQFGRAEAMVQAAELAKVVASPLPGTLLVAHSDFRSVAYCGWVSGVFDRNEQHEWFERHRVRGSHPLDRALQLLQGALGEGG